MLEPVLVGYKRRQEIFEAERSMEEEKTGESEEEQEGPEEETLDESTSASATGWVSRCLRSLRRTTKPRPAPSPAPPHDLGTLRPRSPPDAPSLPPARGEVYFEEDTGRLRLGPFTLDFSWGRSDAVVERQLQRLRRRRLEAISSYMGGS